jgi:hypothetical protein
MIPAVTCHHAVQFPFVRDGFTHELLEREGVVCLVKRSKAARWHYEVVVLQLEPDKTIRDRFYPAHERYPSSEQWGTYGFTYRSDELERATARQRTLVQASASPPKVKDSAPAHRLALAIGFFPGGGLMGPVPP